MQFEMPLTSGRIMKAFSTVKSSKQQLFKQSSNLSINEMTPVGHFVHQRRAVAGNPGSLVSVRV
ncbi:MAG: hypothetical protein ACYSOK_03200 [Planctomycetota bacterium]|jgi:hypothetical protein